MKKRTFLIFTLYLWLRVLYGLIFYPYRTTREIVRHPVLAPVLVTPFFAVGFLFVLGRIGSILLDVYGVNRSFIALVLGTCFFTLLFWQGVIVYFLLSLISAKRRE